jgi:hypothetical protein
LYRATVTSRMYHPRSCAVQLMLWMLWTATRNSAGSWSSCCER